MPSCKRSIAGRGERIKIRAGDTKVKILVCLPCKKYFDRLPRNEQHQLVSTEQEVIDWTNEVLSIKGVQKKLGQQEAARQHG